MKKLLSPASATCCLFCLCCLVHATRLPAQEAVTNASFELPGTATANNEIPTHWTHFEGAWAGQIHQSYSGVPSGMTGTNAVWLDSRSGGRGIYQRLLPAFNPSSAGIVTLQVDVGARNSPPLATYTIGLWNDTNADGAPDAVVAQVTNPVTPSNLDGFQEASLDAPVAAGLDLYVVFDTIDEGVTKQALFDNVRLGFSSKPDVANGQAVTVSGTSAGFVGRLVSSGGSPTTMRVYWGERDGLDAAGAWGHTNTLAGFPDEGWMTNTVSTLATNTVYFYRYYATNSSGEAWASPSEQLMTGPVWLEKLGEASEIGPVSATVAVHRAAGATNGAMSVSYSLSGSATSGSDYAALSGEATFAEGADRTEIAIDTIEDWLGEPDEDAVVTLQPGPYIVGSPDAVTVTVADSGAYPIANPSFELPGTVTISGDSPTYWTMFEAAAYGGQANANEAYIPAGETGQHTLWLDGRFGGKGVYQRVLPPWNQRGARRVSLRVDVGDRSNTALASYTIGLWADSNDDGVPDTRIAEVTNPVTPDFADGFREAVLEADITGGLDLYVRLDALDSGGTVTQVFMDNVRLNMALRGTIIMMR